MIAAWLLAGAHLPGCEQKSDNASRIGLNEIPSGNEEIYRVRLTASKAREYNIRTVPVREQEVSGKWRKVVPATAVVNDGNGHAWTFTSPESLIFIRKPVQVDYMTGELAVLLEGPPSGTRVVTVGAVRLRSNEFKESGERLLQKSVMKGTDKERSSSGLATMKEDGHLRLVYRTRGSTGLTADIVIEYDSTDAEYQKIIDLVGGLEIGETKLVPVSPDK